MADHKVPDRHPWIISINGRPMTVGYVLEGVHYYVGYVDGRRVRRSTRQRDPRLAHAVYEEFTRNPRKALHPVRRRTDPGTGDSPFFRHIDEFIKYSDVHLGNEDAWLAKKEAYLVSFAEFSVTLQTGRVRRVFFDFASFNADDIRLFLEEYGAGRITGRPTGPASYNRALASLKGYMGWAREVRELTANDADKRVPFRPEEKRKTSVVVADEERWRRLRDALPTKWALTQDCLHVIKRDSSGASGRRWGPSAFCLDQATRHRAPPRRSARVDHLFASSGMQIYARLDFSPGARCGSRGLRSRTTVRFRVSASKLPGSRCF